MLISRLAHAHATCSKSCPTTGLCTNYSDQFCVYVQCPEWCSLNKYIKTIVFLFHTVIFHLYPLYTDASYAQNPTSIFLSFHEKTKAPSRLTWSNTTRYSQITPTWWFPIHLCVLYITLLMRCGRNYLIIHINNSCGRLDPHTVFISPLCLSLTNYM